MQEDLGQVYHLDSYTVDIIRYANYQLIIATLSTQFISKMIEPKENYGEKMQLACSDVSSNEQTYSKIIEKDISEELTQLPLTTFENRPKNEYKGPSSFDMFTNWSWIMYLIYSTTVTFFVNLEDKLIARPYIAMFHYINLVTQAYIFVFFMFFLRKLVRKHQDFMSCFTLFGIDLMHITPILTLFIENILFTYQLACWQVAFPIAYFYIYGLYCTGAFYFCKKVIYPMLNAHSKKFFFWAIGSNLQLLCSAFVTMYSRNWINDLWSIDLKDITQ